MYARTGLSALGATLAGLLAGIFAIGHIMVSVKVFGAGGDKHFRNGLVLPVGDIVAIKASHAGRSPPYRIALFGNSRIVEVSHSDLGVSQNDFFNFAVGGTSFRQSVVLLEYLAKIGKAPRLAILSIDNHDIEFAETFFWPPVMTVPARVINDAVRTWEVTDQKTISYWWHSAKYIVEGCQRALAQLRGYFNFARLRLRILFITSQFRNGPQNNLNYLPDGANPIPLTDVSGTPFFRTGGGTEFTVRYADLVEADIGRLAELKAKGIKIIVYESPIHPKLRDQVARTRSRTISEFRNRFMAACVRNSLTCLPAPILDESVSWSDCCHAPPALLGRFIAAML